MRREFRAPAPPQAGIQGASPTFMPEGRRNESYDLGTRGLRQRLSASAAQLGWASRMREVLWSWGGLRFAGPGQPWRGARSNGPHSNKKDDLMKLIATLLGIILIVVAVVYFVVPADSLPSFFPGHEAGMMRVRMKHGVVTGIVGVVLLAAGWWLGRK
jgi:hypothetical protein